MCTSAPSAQKYRLFLAIRYLRLTPKQVSAHPSHYRNAAHLSADTDHHDHAPPFPRWGSKSPPRIGPPPSNPVQSIRAIINGGPSLCCSPVLCGGCQKGSTQGYPLFQADGRRTQGNLPAREASRGHPRRKFNDVACFVSQLSLTNTNMLLSCLRVCIIYWHAADAGSCHAVGIFCVPDWTHLHVLPLLFESSYM